MHFNTIILYLPHASWAWRLSLASLDEITGSDVIIKARIQGADGRSRGGLCCRGEEPGVRGMGPAILLLCLLFKLLISNFRNLTSSNIHLVFMELEFIKNSVQVNRKFLHD